MPFSILNFKWVWQTQFLSHTSQILKNYVFFIDVQMILLSFFDNPNLKFAIQEKPLLLAHFRPQPGNFCLILPGCGLNLKQKISFSKIADFWIEISKNDSNIISLSLRNTQFFKIWWVWHIRRVRHAHLKFKLQMGMAGSIVEPRPSNFAEKCIF